MPESPDKPQPIRTEADSTSADAMRAAVGRQLDEAAAGGVSWVPPPIPDHTLLRRIGSGAYGDVWLARSALGTLRAVKVVYRARFKEDRPYEREFHGLLKYEPISRTHEGLVQVLHVGRPDTADCFYCVMELADAAEAERDKGGKGEKEKRSTSAEADRPLSPLPLFSPAEYSPRTLRSELARHQRLPPVDAAQLVLRLGGALAHLHAHGLVHRDIKPSNVIFVGGQPKLADVGLVTDVGSSHSFVGTDGFIPPEGPGTPQADLYGLGKLLYELATGRDRMDFPQLPPLSSPASSDGEKAGVMDDDSEALLELNEVMTRACAPEPKHRYTSATELQAELNLFLAGRSLRHTRNMERTLARLKRFAVVACVFLALAAGALWFAKNEERHANDRARDADDRARGEVESRRRETRLRERAEAAEKETQRQLYTALFEQARTTVRSGEVGQRVRALDALKRAAAISNNLEVRREALRALATPDLRFEKELPTGPHVTYAELDPDFTRIALGLAEGPVEIRSVADGQLLATLPAGTAQTPCCAQWSTDGRYLALQRTLRGGDNTAELEVWDLTTVRRTAFLANVRSSGMVFHPVRPELMISEGEGAVTFLNVETGEPVARHGLPNPPWRVAYSPDGRYFAATFRSERRYLLSVRDAASNVRRINIELPGQPVTFDWHPGGRWLAIPVTDGRLLLADVQTGLVVPVGRHKGAAIRALFSPDGDFLFGLDTDGDWVCWSFAGMMVQFTVGGQSSFLQFRKDGRQCALGTVNSVKLYSFERPACERELSGAIGECIRPAAFSADGRWVAVPGEGKIGIWDMTTNVWPLMMAATPNSAVFFSEDSSALFIWSQTNLLRWPVSLKTDPPNLKEELLNTRGTTFQSAEVRSNLMVVATRESVELFQITNAIMDGRRSFPTAKGHGTVSPDGRWFCLRFDMTPRLDVFRLPEMTPVVKLTNSATVWGAAFTPRGDELAVLTRVGVVFLETKTWRPTRELPAELGVLSAIRFAPDGQTFWLNRDLRNAALHDAQTLEERLVVPMGLLPLALDPSGRRLLIAVDGQRLQVWDLAAMRERFRELGMDWAGPK